MTATIAGDGADLHRDGTGTTPSAAQKAGSLNMPFGVAACPNGRCLFVSDHHNRAVRVVDLEHAYQLRTKPDGLSTTRDNKELGVQKYVPEEDLYVAALRTLVGSGLENDMDGAGRTAGFYGPAGIGISPDNQHLFVCDREGNRIRQVQGDSVCDTCLPHCPFPLVLTSICIGDPRSGCTHHTSGPTSVLKNCDIIYN